MIILFLLVILIIIALVRYYSKSNDIIEGLNTFNGRLAIDDQYFYDQLFDNVTYYPNKYVDDYELNDIEIRGIDKCYRDCKGYCTEFGLTGIAYCFEENDNVQYPRFDFTDTKIL